MSEGTIKETMDRLYGVGTIPKKKVTAEEMKRLIMESKVQLQAKKSKRIESMKTEGTKDIEKGRMDNYPCPKCKKIKWMEVPDGTCRYYCLKCGEVIPFPSTDVEVTEQHKTPAPAFDEVEKKVGSIDLNDKITETDTNKELRQVNPKIAGDKERFHHPRVENAICNGCFHDMGCPRTFQHQVLCLLNNMDYKMKRLGGD